MTEKLPITTAQFSTMAARYNAIKRGLNPLRFRAVVSIEMPSYEIRWALIAINPENWNDVYAIRIMNRQSFPEVVRVRLGDLLSLRDLLGEPIRRGDTEGHPFQKLADYLEAKVEEARDAIAQEHLRLRELCGDSEEEEEEDNGEDGEDDEDDVEDEDDDAEPRSRKSPPWMRPTALRLVQRTSSSSLGVQPANESPDVRPPAAGLDVDGEDDPIS